MLSLVLVGSSTTRIVDGDPPRLYTPRGYFPARARPGDRAISSAPAPARPI